MMYPITGRQQDLLRFIVGFQQAHGFSPSYDEMADALGYAGRNGVHGLVDRLVDRGALRRIPRRTRSIEVLVDFPIPRAPDGAPLRVVPGFAGQTAGGPC